MENGLQKKYGLFTAICMVAGIVIGSGVFFKAQTILEKTGGDMPLGILAWIIGGLIMLSCILAFATMAGKYEKVNGVVDYAEATVGEKYGYYIGWFMATIYTPTLTSVLAWLTARYTLVFITSTFPSVTLAIPVEQGGCVTGPECMALALVYMCIAYAMNALSPVIAGKFQVATTVIKLIPLLLMAVVGIAVGLMSKNHLLVQNMTAAPVTDATVNGSPLFAAVVATAFAYEGWIIATSINAELKDAKKNLPIALIAGSIIIIAVYISYYIGVAGGATVEELISLGATVAFTNVFGTTFGAILNLFIAISCMGTLNGLMLGCTRGFYSLAIRGRGPKEDVFNKVDESTNMANNSAIVGLLLCGFWFFFFYGSNLAPFPWFGKFGFDSSELPIITIYAMYIPVFIGFMKKATDLPALKRFVIPGLALCGSIFMVFAALYSHGLQPYLAAKANGTFACPVLFYLIIFAVVMLIGVKFVNGKKK
ncbi:MAG: APC family permease [Firmicutes bacterium]|nr:APC family permease [Bacillota bacterium]MBQ9973207.1 APC family permease [Bacillota bacterium]